MRSRQHCYNVIMGIIHDMVLSPRNHVRFLLFGITYDASASPNNLKPIYTSLYVDELFSISRKKFFIIIPPVR